MKKFAKDVWDFVWITSLLWWAGVSVTAGAIAAADFLGVSVAIAYEAKEK